MPVKGSDFLATQEKNVAREGRGHGGATAVPKSKPEVFVGVPPIAFGRKGVIFVFISLPDI